MKTQTEMFNGYVEKIREEIKKTPNYPCWWILDQIEALETFEVSGQQIKQAIDSLFAEPNVFQGTSEEWMKIKLTNRPSSLADIFNG